MCCSSDRMWSLTRSGRSSQQPLSRAWRAARRPRGVRERGGTRVSPGVLVRSILAPYGALGQRREHQGPEQVLAPAAALELRGAVLEVGAGAGLGRSTV